MDMVFDASTLILLAKIDFLRDVAEEITIYIPEKVRDECLVKESFDAQLIAMLIRERTIRIKKRSTPQIIKRLQKDFKLHTGEAEALSLAMDMACPLAIDDGVAIKACRILKVQFTTAIHLLLKAVTPEKMGYEMAVTKLENLIAYGRYHRKIIEHAFKQLEGMTDERDKP